MLSFAASKVFGVGQFKYDSTISREPMGLLWQPNLGKISQNCTDFSSVQDTKTMLTCMVGFSGWGKSNMLSTILREARELPWQPNLDKISQNCRDFSFVQDMETLFAYG